MKLPSLQRFQKQNYADAPPWFARFLADLSGFTETVWNIMNKNLTPADNLDAQVYATTFLAGATAASNAFTFQTNLKHTVSAVIVGQVTDQAAYSAPLSSAVGVTWSVAGTTVSISGVSGLTAGQTYRLVLLLL